MLTDQSDLVADIVVAQQPEKGKGKPRSGVVINVSILWLAHLMRDSIIGMAGVMTRGNKYFRTRVAMDQKNCASPRRDADGSKLHRISPAPSRAPHADALVCLIMRTRGYHELVFASTLE